ncbi:hypothetical protein AHF37_05244 [Paragonimus kellicotti]|nr:hypothetical protein AHF37_05244 [Paragonimus kellicotti]
MASRLSRPQRPKASVRRFSLNTVANKRLTKEDTQVVFIDETNKVHSTDIQRSLGTLQFSFTVQLGNVDRESIGCDQSFCGRTGLLSTSTVLHCPLTVSFYWAITQPSTVRDISHSSTG